MTFSNAPLWVRLIVTNVKNEKDPFSDPNNQKRFFELTVNDEISFGRKPTNTIHLPESAVSGFHAKLFTMNGQLFLQDLGSSNGTVYGGHLVPRGDNIPLRSGDIFEIVHYAVQVDIGSSRRELEAIEGQNEIVNDIVGKFFGNILQDESVPPRLVVESDPHRGKTLEIRAYGSYIIGRGRQCQFAILDQNISREHAQLNRTIDGFSLFDLNSRNGVQVNGQRIHTNMEVPVKHGDQVMIGAIQCTFSDPVGASLQEKMVQLQLIDPVAIGEPDNYGIPKPSTPPPATAPPEMGDAPAPEMEMPEAGEPLPHE